MPLILVQVAAAFILIHRPKDDSIQITSIFEATTSQELEKEHDQPLFKPLYGGEDKIGAGFPAGIIGTTTENLRREATDEDL